jgi:hypothetical protein
MGNSSTPAKNKQ